jgi:trimeric autotransporter adhesin
LLTVDGNGSLLWAAAPSGGGGGAAWLLGGNAGTAAGQFLGTTDSRPLELRTDNQTGLRLSFMKNASSEIGVNILGGYVGNSIAAGATAATIGGGGKRDADGTDHPNRILGSYATVAGGFDNFGGDVGTVVGGGSRNRTTDAYATVAGGLQNSALGNSSTVAGGFNNQAGSANGLFATAGGGANNIASGEFATVPGGSLNQATGLSSFAAGHRALATNDGAFVWADGTEDNFGSAVTNEFAVRARGGVRLDTGGQGLNLDGTILNRDISGALVVVNTNADSQVSHAGIAGYAIGASGHGVEGDSDHGAGVAAFSDSGYGVRAYSETGTGVSATSNGSGGRALELRVVVGGELIAGLRTDNSIGDVQVFTVASDGTVTGKAFNTTSDRHAKEGFTAINPRAVLDKVAALPISQWRFKGDEAVSHVGPMAQDFHAAFGLGQDDKHIATVDEEGVALAAIQGLHQVMQEKDAEIHDLKQSVAELKAMVEQLARRQNK